MCPDPARRGSRRARHRARGFTLLEVLVALAIAGIAFVGLFRAGTTGLFAVDTAARTEEAVERAQSHLAALGRDVALLQGDTDGDDGGGYHWRLRVQPMGSLQIAPQPSETGAETTLFDVEVTITWDAGGRSRSVALRSQRLGTTAAQG